MHRSWKCLKTSSGVVLKSNFENSLYMSGECTLPCDGNDYCSDDDEHGDAGDERFRFRFDYEKWVVVKFV